MLRITKKGQSTAEYAIVIGLVIAAVLAMQVYVKRGIQGKIKDAVNHTEAGDTITGATKQYEPYYMQSTMTSGRQASESENLTTGGAVSRTASDTSSRTGSQTITTAIDQ